MKAVRKLLLPVLLFAGIAGTYAQDLGIKDYLLIGVDAAETISERYLKPIPEGILYGLSSGWYHNAKSADRWEVRLGLVTNGSLVPADTKNFTLNVGDFENLSVIGGAQQVTIPTILGPRDSRVTFQADVEGQTFTFDAPTGIGLLQLNLLPSAFLQAGVGLGGNLEAQVRYFPKITIGDGALGIKGLGLKYQLNGDKGIWQDLPVDMALMGAYTRLNATYDLPEDGNVQGFGHEVDGFMNAWLTEVLVSTRYDHWNLFGGTGYVWGNSKYELKGTYQIELPNRTLEYVDPFALEESVSGFRFTLGGSYTAGWFTTHASYTLQGYNNLSFGFNFRLN